MASSSSPQGRSIASPKPYDAFISHRGPDVKETLAKQLYECLQERGCRAFLDREEIEGGDSIPFAIRNAICSSVVQLAIFSKGYAKSSWCLNELVLMLEQTDSLFIPVFYDVEPWELRHIENNKSWYAAAFSDYESKGRNLDKLGEWKKALASAADISGYELSQHQDNLCETILSRVLQVVEEKEKSTPLYVAKYPVGLAKLVQDFERSCSKKPRDKVTIIGIFGLGGSGKTTLAKELFNRKRSSYHTSCFLSDVRESHARGELHCLQSQLLKDLFPKDKKIKDLEIWSSNQGIGELKNRLGRARHLHFLIILDDIDHENQLDALLPEGMLSFGSLVIITTRDQCVLRGADIRYKMKRMDEDHAKELFCSHAFRGRNPPIAYEKLVEGFVKFCGCLPLSLIVLGAHVYNRDEHYWKLELEKVEKIQPKDIMQRLQISFDGLDKEEKQIFIDIACLFNQKRIPYVKSKAILVWNASGWSAEHAVRTLQEKCLVEVVSNKFEMHDHLRDLGRQIADDLGPPRLWRPDILRSMEAKGFKQILAEAKGRCFHSFEDMSLKRKLTFFIGNLKDSAESDLLWLEIQNHHRSLRDGNLKCFPSWIPLRKLQCLSIYRVEELWNTFQQQLQINTQGDFQLRRLEIFNSPSLQKLPDLIRMSSHLEELEISSSLENTDITSFVQSLKKLSNLRSLVLQSGDRGFFSGILDLSKCMHSTNLGASTSSCMNSLETIEFGNLENISKLLISGEICPRLQSLTVHHMGDLNEMHMKNLERLNTLVVRECPKVKTVSGLSYLTGLQYLRVLKCFELQRISGLSSLTGLRSLVVKECSKVKTISGLSSGLRSLIVKICPQVETISELSSLTGLQFLKIWVCPKLKTISGLSSLTGLQVLSIVDCSKWDTIPGLSSLTGLQEFAAMDCEGLKSLPTFAHLRRLERAVISNCHLLQSTEGVEELPLLKSLVIEVPDDGYAWVRNCIYGLRRLPSKKTILIQKSVDKASSKLNVNLFSEAIDAQPVEIERGEHELEMRSSPGAITIYALLVTPNDFSGLLTFESRLTHKLPPRSKRMITVLLTQNDSEGWVNDSRGSLKNVKINKGFKATMNEGKSLVVLQRIVDRLYGESVVPKLAAYDVLKRKRKRKY